MGTLYLVRHGQASFGAADYDQLSPLGTRQCHALGEYLADRGLQFEAVLRGSLRRHVQSLAALAAGHRGLPAAQEWPGLNEYDGEALVRAIHDGPAPDAHTPEGYREHFRLLRSGLQGWMAGSSAPQGLPRYVDWVAGITAALDHVRSQHSGDVLVVSSGGPIATIVGQVLGAPAETTIDLNMRIRNSALTELSYSARRCTLLSFNHLPHLDHPDRRAWVSYS
jgi:broad specificity phosphatase PhoE